MTLTGPRAALADQSNFIGYLVGLAGLAKAVHTLADDVGRRPEDPCESGDFVHMLLGIASLGNAVQRLAVSTTAQSDPIENASPPAATTARWLR